MDNDEVVLEDAKEAVFSLDKQYRRAIRNRDVDAMRELKPKVDDANDAYSNARRKLLEDGVLTTDADLAEMRRIRAEIDQAADKQGLITGAVKLVGFLMKLA